MASVKFNRREFEKHIKLTPEIEEKIRLFGTPLETVTKDEVEIEIFPNRPDLLSLQGYLRSFRAFIGKEKGLPKYPLASPDKNFKVIVDDSVSEIRPYTLCAVVRGLAFSDERIKEIVDLQEKLHATVGRNRKRLAIGIYPMEKIALPIRYAALSPDKIKFRPLESEKEMSGNDILQRHPTGKEYAHLLSGLDKYPVFLDSNDKVLSMPPVINSHDTGKVTKETKDVFVECSGFDLHALEKTLNIIVTTMADFGGKVFQMDIAYKKSKMLTPSLEPEKIKVSLESANALLGLDLTEKEMQKCLEKMGYDFSKGSVLVPAWRTDVMHEVDVIEDVAIAYGYDKIVPELPSFASIAAESPKSRLKSRIAEILCGLSLLETSTYHLIKAEEAKSAKIHDPIEVENSKTDYKVLRPSLLIPALRILGENKDNEYPQRIFEIGPIFRRDGKEIAEEESLLICLAPGSFTDSKRVVDSLLGQLGLSNSLSPAENGFLVEGRTASINVAGDKIGFVGETHPETLRAWSIKMPVSIISISIDALAKHLAK